MRLPAAFEILSWMLPSVFPKYTFSMLIHMLCYDTTVESTFKYFQTPNTMKALL